MIAHTAAIALLLFPVIVTSLTHPRSDPNHNNNKEDIVVSFANTNTKPTQRSLLRGVRRVLPHWLGLDGFHANDNNNLFIKDSNFDEEAISKAASPSEEELMIKEGDDHPDVPKEVVGQATNNPVYEGNEMDGDNPLFEEGGGLRGRRLPHVITFDGVGMTYDPHEKENENIFIDEAMVKEGDQPTGVLGGPHPPLPSPTVVIPPRIIDDESIVVPKDELSGSVEDSSVKSVLVEEDKPIIDRLKPDTTLPSAPLEDTEPEVIAELQQETEKEGDELLTYKLKDVIITSVLNCTSYSKSNPYWKNRVKTLTVENDDELPPYIVSAVACGAILNETPPKDEPITWATYDKSMGTNYGKQIIWEDEADDFRIGSSIIRSKADGILKVLNNDESLEDQGFYYDYDNDSYGTSSGRFEDKWPDAGDYDLVAKRIWGEESGDFIVKLIWEAEADDFIIQVGNKVTYSVKYDDMKKKGVIVKK